MSKELDNILKEISLINKNLNLIDKKYTKEVSEVKKILKQIHNNVDETLEKIKEFEIVLETAEELNEEYEDEWTPYEDYEPEDYENDADDDDF